MFSVNVLRYALYLLSPLSLTLTSYLYLYPIFHLCAFPAPPSSGSALSNTLRDHVAPSKHSHPAVAPFRLLALGDPQLEGDTSLPDPDTESFPNLSKFWEDALLLNGVEHNFLQRIRHSLHDLVDFYFDDLPALLLGYRKRIDLVGNDLYLAHIYRTLHWWTRPTHVTVLGDLIGSQWIDDQEFTSRSSRFWNNVFKHAERVSDELTAERPAEDKSTLVLGEDPELWRWRIMNVAGNHDIGYAGDLDEARLARFERIYGRANYELRFQLSTPSQDNLSALSSGDPSREIPELRIVLLNDMNLDAPASSKELQDATYSFLNRVISQSHDVRRSAHFTLLLTHIPLYKAAGICVDPPFFDYFDDVDNNGVKEQNHLSSHASKGIFEGLYGMSGNPAVDGKGFGRPGLMLVGHDHEGCDVWHYINQSQPEDERIWQASPIRKARQESLMTQPSVPGLREITVRSMMGEFGGNAGLLSLWFDADAWEWQYEFDTCALGQQHIWWAVHVIDLITVGFVIAFCCNLLLQKFGIRVERGQVRNEKPDATKQIVGGSADMNGHGLLTPPGSGKKSLKKKRSRSKLKGAEAAEATGRLSLEKIFERPQS
ncbi:MAG: hypothetical protein M1818_006772 [Claussenomyces sp. TS43310]|nr:MAG: hypothetical protein M1818_006772 [Claussenomyces sp. TS43310]